MPHRRLALVLLILLIYPAGILAQDRLRILDTRYYRIHTDLEHEFAEELARRMDAMHEEYSRRLAEFRLPPNMPRFEVYLFARQNDYMRFTGNRFPNTGGVFMSGRNLLAAFHETQGRDAMRRVLQHEAFHQFAHTAIGPNLPVWLNEGLAQVFEEGIWTGSGFEIGQVPPRRLRQLQADIQSEQLIEFPTMLAMSYGEWSEHLSNSAEFAATMYNQAWAMAHFLVFAQDAHGRPRYRQQLIDMLKLMQQGHSSEEAFREVFAGNVAGFQARFIEFARRLSATPEATLIERQGVLADLLRALSSEGMTFRDMQSFQAAVTGGGYRIQYTKGQIKWQTEANAAIYFSDLNGRPFSRNDLYFELRGGAPLPDIICRVSPQVQLRTRFHRTGNDIEHEILIEPRG